MNKYNFLNFKNKFITLKDVENTSKNVLTPILINFTHEKKYLLILLDLKTNKILSHQLLDTPWRSNDMVKYITSLILTSTIPKSNLVFHVLKQNPFTTNNFAILVTTIRADLSYYSRVETLKNIYAARTFFRKYPKYSQLNFIDLNNIITSWNNNVSEKLNITIDKYTETSGKL